MAYKQLIFLCMAVFHLVFWTSTAQAYVPLPSSASQHNFDLQQFPTIENSASAELHPTQKVAYLTFDDGPNKYTPQILDILQSTNTKATFFVIGNRITRFPQALQRMMREGHYLGLHSMSHIANRLYTGNPSPLLTEMDQTRQLVLTATGLDTHLIRVPYGSKPYLNEVYRNALAQAHFKLWDWTIDTYDWEQKSTPSSVLQQVAQQTHRDTEVILMHDSSITAEVLPQLIQYLRSKGYVLLPYNPTSHIEVNFWHDTRL